MHEKYFDDNKELGLFESFRTVAVELSGISINNPDKIVQFELGILYGNLNVVSVSRIDLYDRFFEHIKKAYENIGIVAEMIDRERYLISLWHPGYKTKVFKNFYFLRLFEPEYVR